MQTDLYIVWFPKSWTVLPSFQPSLFDLSSQLVFLTTQAIKMMNSILSFTSIKINLSIWIYNWLPIGLFFQFMILVTRGTFPCTGSPGESSNKVNMSAAPILLMRGKKLSSTTFTFPLTNNCLITWFYHKKAQIMYLHFCTCCFQMKSVLIGTSICHVIYPLNTE